MVDVVVDGGTDFMGGQDAARVPDRIPDNCYAAGINVSVRNGALHPRWGFERRTVKWPEGYVLDLHKKRRTYQNLFESGKFQAIAPYQIGLSPYFIIVVGGMIFGLDLNTMQLITMPIQGGTTLNSRAARINWAAAGRYLVLFDFPAYPVIIDGLLARRANPYAYEVPVSRMGTYNQNRLFIANGGDEYTAGDPVGNVVTPDAPITFEEFLRTGASYYGQAFQLPTTNHNKQISYMGFLQVTDTSTGIGPLILGTTDAIYSCQSQNPRANWTAGQFGSMVCFNAGIAGPRAFCNVNSDAFFISNDGFARSLTMSRDAQRTWSRVPISREVDNWFKTWDPSLARFAFVGYFRNKIFFSVNPYRQSVIDYETLRPISDYAHGGLAVMELDNMASLGQVTTPIWAGLWTGIRPMDMAVIDERAFVVAKEGGINTLWEINPNITYDSADDRVRHIRSRVYTRSYDFKDPFTTKSLTNIDVNFDALRGDLVCDVRYRPSHSDSYRDWTTLKHRAPWRQKNMPRDCLLNGFAPHYIRDVTLESPRDSTSGSPVTDDLYRDVRKVQLQLTIEAIYWELRELRIRANPRPQPLTVSACQMKEPAICRQCSDDWAIPPFNLCDARCMPCR